MQLNNYIKDQNNKVARQQQVDWKFSKAVTLAKTVAIMAGLFLLVIIIIK